MPYVDIPWESHKEDCPDPVAKRLYIRNYDKNGKQRFVPWGVTCENCGVILKQEYEHNLTKNQIERKKMSERWKSSPHSKEYEDAIVALVQASGPRLSKKELERRNMEYRKKRKLQQRKRRLLPGGRMSMREMSYRQRIRQLKRMYENDCYYYKVLKKNNMINWDDELVEKYLSTRPSITDMNFVLRDLSPLRRDTMKQARRVRGWIPDPEKTKQDHYSRQWYKKDRSHYYKEDNHWRYNSDANIVGEYEKLVIREAEQRQRWMKKKIRRHEEKGLETLAQLVRLKT